MLEMDHYGDELRAMGNAVIMMYCEAEGALSLELALWPFAYSHILH